MKLKVKVPTEQELAQNYCKQLDEWQRFQAQAKDARTELVTFMVANGMTSISLGDRQVELVTTHKLKVSRIK